MEKVREAFPVIDIADRVLPSKSWRHDADQGFVVNEANKQENSAATKLLTTLINVDSLSTVTGPALQAALYPVLY